MEYKNHFNSNMHNDRSDKLWMKAIRRRRKMMKALKCMCATMFLLGLLMVIGVAGSIEVSAEDYTQFKFQIATGFSMMTVASLWASKMWGNR